MRRREMLVWMTTALVAVPLAQQAYAQGGGGGGGGGGGRGGGMGMGKGKGPGMADSELAPDPQGLLTEQERLRFRERMQNAKTAGERQQIRDEHQQLLRDRQRLRDGTGDMDRDRDRDRDRMSRPK